MTREASRRRTLIGKVVSDKMDKTIVVTVEVYRRHPLYGRLIRHTRKFKAHDATNRCHVGDQVEIRESRPLSREKRWVLTRVLQVGQEEIQVADVPEAQKATS